MIRLLKTDVKVIPIEPHADCALTLLTDGADLWRWDQEEDAVVHAGLGAVRFDPTPAPASDDCLTYKPSPGDAVIDSFNDPEPGGAT